jgi:hypothetical protein
MLPRLQVFDDQAPQTRNGSVRTLVLSEAKFCIDWCILRLKELGNRLFGGALEPTSSEPDLMLVLARLALNP